MATDPFDDPAIEAQIHADIARIQADWLKWTVEAAEGNLDEKGVETLVANLDAYARGYLRAVDHGPRIVEYLSRLRHVGSLLIRNQRERGCLSDPYSEDRLCQIAESSGELIQLKLSGPPVAYAAALESEIERTRIAVRREAEQDLYRRNAMFSRVETLFEARYRYWEAEAIEKVLGGHRGLFGSRPASPATESPGEGALPQNPDMAKSEPAIAMEPTIPPDLGTSGQWGPHIEPKMSSDEERPEVFDRATKRQMVVNPILKKKRWKRGRLVTQSGVGKATVYGYLDGTRSWITTENRRAMAEALGIATEALPE